MRVAIISDTYHPDVNGVVNTINYLEEEFSKLDFNYKLFSPGDVNKSDEKHHHFKSIKFWFYNKLNFSFITYGTLKQALDQYDPEVIHIYTEGPLGILGTKYAKDKNIPYIASYTTDLPSYFKYYTFDLFKSGLVLYLKYVHSSAFLNLVPSQYSLAQLNDMKMFNNVIWKRGIDTEKFYPLEGKVLGEKKKLLYVGRIAKEKNIQTLLDMAMILTERGFPFELHIVGHGPIFDELSSENIENTVFHGAITGEALQEMYRNCDAFVFASEHETFGNVVLEAMASGLPVIASYSAGVKENIQDNYNGIAIYYTKDENFANAVEKLFSEEGLYERLAKNAREYTLDKSWKNLTLTLIRYYEMAYQSKGE